MMRHLYLLVVLAYNVRMERPNQDGHRAHGTKNASTIELPNANSLKRSFDVANIDVKSKEKGFSKPTGQT